MLYTLQTIHISLLSHVTGMPVKKRTYRFWYENLKKWRCFEEAEVIGRIIS
jgi:hypothetical protein